MTRGSYVHVACQSIRDASQRKTDTRSRGPKITSNRYRVPSLLPVMGTVWAKNGVVRSVIDWPVGLAGGRSLWKKPAEKLSGIDYRPYVEALAAQRVGTAR